MAAIFLLPASYPPPWLFQGEVPASQNGKCSYWDSATNHDCYAYPYTAKATKIIALTESIGENSDVMVSFDNVIASVGIAVASITGTSSLTVEFYAVKTPKTTVTGTIGGVK